MLQKRNKFTSTKILGKASRILTKTSVPKAVTVPEQNNKFEHYLNFVQTRMYNTHKKNLLIFCKVQKQVKRQNKVKLASEHYYILYLC